MFSEFENVTYKMQFSDALFIYLEESDVLVMICSDGF